MTGWPGALPLYGAKRAAAVEGLVAAIADDTWKSLACMVADGWDVVDAAHAYREWLLEVVSAGMWQGVRWWREGIPPEEEAAA